MVKGVLKGHSKVRWPVLASIELQHTSPPRRSHCSRARSMWWVVAERGDE